MRVGHYLRVAWLLTELGENSVFLEKRTRTSENAGIVAPKYFWCTTSSSVSNYLLYSSVESPYLEGHYLDSERPEAWKAPKIKASIKVLIVRKFHWNFQNDKLKLVSPHLNLCFFNCVWGQIWTYPNKGRKGIQLPSFSSAILSFHTQRWL